MDRNVIDDNTSLGRSRVDVLPPLESYRTRTPAPPSPGLLVLSGALALAAGWLAWDKWGPQPEGDIVGTSMIAFERQNALTVFASQFDVVSESTSTPSIGPLEIDALATRQAMIVPARVEYRLDLSDMERADFAWDEATGTLDVTLPDIEISRPNLDESKARIFRQGVWTSADASASLGRSNSQQAERRALSFAENPEIMTLARSAARDAVRQNLAIPLQVAGFGEVTVNVRFEDE